MKLTRAEFEEAAEPAARRRFVAAMFDEIAPRYDDFTRLFSFGMDKKWKRELMAEVDGSLKSQSTSPSASSVTSLPKCVVLDLASGTGDLARAIAERFPHAEVIAVDASERMALAAAGHNAAVEHNAAAGHTASARITAAAKVTAEVVVGDMTHLPFAQRTITAATAGYGFRNVADHRAALREVASLTQSGGQLAVLDFYLPRSRIWRAIFLWYLAVAGYLVGWWWHGSPFVYGYIAHSIRRYVTAEQFEADMVEAGYRVLTVRTWLGGGIAAHVGRRI